MTGIINFVLIYIFLLLVWSILNLILFCVSILFRKNLSSISLVLSVLLDNGIQLFLFGYALYILWLIIKAHEWLLLIFALVFGGFILGLWQTIYGLLLSPFNMVSFFFTSKFEDINQRREEEFVGEYISPEGKVIDKFESEARLNRRLAKYFIADYLVNLLYILTHPQQYKIYGWADYIFTPAFFMLQMMIVFGLIIGIYNMIRHKKFIYPDKKSYLIKVFKFDIITLIGIQVLATILYVFFVA